MKLIAMTNYRFSHRWPKASLALTLILGLSAENAVRADEVTNFYVGKQMTMLVGFGVGGGGDVYARLLARHLGDHTPGKPTIIVRSCFWANAAKDEALRGACTAVNGIHVDISTLSKDEKNYARSERPYKHAGVANHPGDAGMAAIAEVMVKALPK